ncbi:MAG: aspartyl protease family protein [Planctomycetota bacterium]
MKIGLHAQTVKARRASGDSVPAPIIGNAMIDSGATVTAIDADVAKRLGLKPSGTVEAVGIGGKTIGITVACSVDIKGLVLDLPRAPGHDLSKYCPGLIALIGRDILRHMVFHYDGPKGTVYLEIPDLAKPAPRGAPKKPKKKPKRRKRK